MGAMIQALETELVKSFGSLWVLALIITVILFIMLLSLGIDVKFCLMFLTPLLATFTTFGWIPLWAGIMASLLTIGFGGYMMWNDIMRG